MEKLATLHYINLAFIPRNCNVAPKQKFPMTMTFLKFWLRVQLCLLVITYYMSKIQC